MAIFQSLDENSKAVFKIFCFVRKSLAFGGCSSPATDSFGLCLQPN